jgi:aminoglycoside phosphotransferase (APT) family kinase protein
MLAASVSGEDVERARLRRTMSTTWIAVSGPVVVKVHVPGTDRYDLTRRLALASAHGMDTCVVAPLLPEPVALGTAGRETVWGTVWPLVTVLPEDVDDAPWAESGALLARLHQIPVPAPADSLPVQGAVARCRAALARLGAVTRVADSRGVLLPEPLTDAARIVRDAADGLPEASWSPWGGSGRPRCVVHGDWHLGQLGRLRHGVGADPAPLRLIDVDDLGVGDPVWDLARPAAFLAAGLMPPGAWPALLDGYRDGGGPALPSPSVDPWPVLDAVAQSCLVLAAAGAVRRAVERCLGAASSSRQGPVEGAEGQGPAEGAEGQGLAGEGPAFLDDLGTRLVNVCSGLPGSSRRGGQAGSSVVPQERTSGT